MPKVNPRTIQADWSRYEKKRPTWSYITSAELAKVLGVHLQTISNWRIRGILPEPDSHPRLRGNKRYYRISKIRSWLENRPEDEIHWEWIKQNMKTGSPYSSLEQAQNVARACHKIFGIEKTI